MRVESGLDKPRFPFTTVVGGLIGLLVLGATAAMAVGALGRPKSNGPSEEFQRLVGGLGGGPAVELSGCEFSFDPRLCEECSLNHGPVPGGVFFCRQHGCSILFCKPLISQSK